MSFTTEKELKLIRMELQKLTRLLDDFLVEYKYRRDEAGCDGLSDKQVSEVRFLDAGPDPFARTPLDPDNYITDGFGSFWDKICPTCHRETIHIVRPGKAQCSHCG